MRYKKRAEALVRRLAEAERRIGDLEGEVPAPEGQPSAASGPEVREADTGGRSSRRQVFKLLGSAAAGATTMALIGAPPASAADGSALTIGEANTAEAATELSFDGVAGSLTTAGVASPLFSIDASTSSTEGSGSGGNGIQATGDTGLSGVVGTAASGFGVYGVTTDLGGVVGLAQSANFGDTPDYGVDLVALGNGNLGQFALPEAGLTNGVPNFTSSLAPSGFELLRDTDGGLWSSDSTGAFHPVLSVVPLPAPVRVINTTNGTGGITGPLAPSASVHTSTELAGTNGIPLNAVGVVGNFAISGVGGALLNGYGVATIFPAGVTAPVTANINAGAACFAISNAITVAFGTWTDAGKVSILWTGGGPVPSVHAFLDVTGYLQ